MKDLFRQAFTILFARGFTRAFQFVAFLAFARLLSPEDFGWFGILTTAFALAALLGSLGLRQSVAYQIGREHMSVGAGVATTLAVWPLLSVAAAAVLYLTYGDQVPDFSGWTTALLLVAGVGGAMLLMLLQGIYLGRGEVNAFSLTETMPRTLLALVAVVLFFTGANFQIAIWAHVLSFALVVPVALWLAMRGVTGLRVDLRSLAPMVKYGIPFAINMFLVTLCARVSMFVIEHFYDASHAGQFFAAVRVNEIFLEAATAFGLVLFSHSVRTPDDGAGSVVARNARIACWIFWLFSLLGLGVAAIAPYLLLLLLGNDYASAGPALQLMAVGLGPAAASKIVYPTIAGQGKPMFGTAAIAVSLGANLALAWQLVPLMGVMGGVVALVVGQYLLYIGYAVTCSRVFKAPLRSFLWPYREDLAAIVAGLATAGTAVIKRVRG